MSARTLWMVVGVRPQYLKAAALAESLRPRGVDVRTLDTRQHYDDLLNSQVVADVELHVHSAADVSPGRGPLHHLAKGIDLVAQTIGDASSTDAAVLVFGDANPAVVGAVAANALGLPLIHVEAGARRNPIEREHWNSKMVDAVARVRFAVTKRHMDELSAEGLAVGSYLTGDLAIQWYRDRWKSGETPLRSGVLITLHRPDNMKRKVLDACVEGCLLSGAAVSFVLHPRNVGLVERSAWKDSIEVIGPQKPSAILDRLRRSSVLLTDSGGLAREAHYLGTPVLMRRDFGGWPELLSFGVLRRVEASVEDVSAGLCWARELAKAYPSGSPLFVEGGLQLALDKILEECRR